jgi:hypothetical protein
LVVFRFAFGFGVVWLSVLRRVARLLCRGSPIRSFRVCIFCVFCVRRGLFFLGLVLPCLIRGSGDVYRAHHVLGRGLVDTGAVFSAEGVLPASCEVRFEVVRANEVFDVQKGGAFEPNVDEGGLQTRQNPRDLT